MPNKAKQSIQNLPWHEQCKLIQSRIENDKKKNKKKNKKQYNQTEYYDGKYMLHVDKKIYR